MSKRFLLDPLKVFLRSPSEKKYRCHWCHERFRNQVKLSEHLQSTEEKISGNRQECVPISYCDWCNARFRTHFHLLWHIRGTTRSTSPMGQQCLLDPPDHEPRLLQADDGSASKEVYGTEVAERILHHDKTSLNEPVEGNGYTNTWMASTFEPIVEEDESQDVTSSEMLVVQVEKEQEVEVGSASVGLESGDAKAGEDKGIVTRALPSSIGLDILQSRAAEDPNDLDTDSSTVPDKMSDRSYYPDRSFLLSTTDLPSLDYSRNARASRIPSADINLLNGLSPNNSTASNHNIPRVHTNGTSIAYAVEEITHEVCDLIIWIADGSAERSVLTDAIARRVLCFVVDVYDVRYLFNQVESYVCKISSGPLDTRAATVFSSRWLDHLKSRGLLLDPQYELNWSGRGQHVEYDPKDEGSIPLTTEKILGHSATAIVDSVKCRRIRLARKKIRCTRRLTKEAVIVEVEHLHRLQHFHVLRVVGTYTLRKDLAIMLYPATPWNLDEFMDELLDTRSVLNTDVLLTGTWRKRTCVEALKTFFGCLAHSLMFIHSKNVKHMDIEPKNLLVCKHGDTYKIYVANFGIARAYKCATDSETDSPTAFTRRYAAPEVVTQDTRGFSADVFSLGCVFLEMLATVISDPSRNERQRLADTRTSDSGDSSFNANLTAVRTWFQTMFETKKLEDDRLPTDVLAVVPEMIQYSPQQRPSAAELNTKLSTLGCGACDTGPEPFEAADTTRA
ncbi:kinase-like protein [Dothidotthia symphoricarpi CBS 119687]|uniref:Kinase-like protein n=1 Tax=Dothidotthia symphoricarpi CBS 119687 TaxID=1392245 RepID=A0A6A6AEU0_9PLEO|nr:kinase-like protein [Dothidotthia symphoricarpi CBS 119687]KAF2128921.1 kinase-like protein [Dothidotthia symphoricarpi CBS 119687]